tara:strand:- start:3746 stop:3949 length:204 start_codon:yes stop_codon:yes gene_type:complete
MEMLKNMAVGLATMGLIIGGTQLFLMIGTAIVGDKEIAATALLATSLIFMCYIFGGLTRSVFFNKKS